MTGSRLALAAALLLADAALVTTASADTEATDAAKPAKERKICRSEAATGSIMAKRTCRTKAEWARIDGQNERDAHASLDTFNRTRSMTQPH